MLGGDAFVRFLPTRFNTDGDALDSHSMPCQMLACPRCHLEIPRIFLTFVPLIFSMIGVPFSGKSYLLAAMTWELARTFPEHFRILFGDVDSGSNQTMLAFQRLLFLQGNSQELTVIEKTQTESDTHYASTNLDGQSVYLPKPFFYRITPLEGHPNEKAPDKVSKVLCIYDNAGEHFLPGMDTSLAPGTQHMAHSRVLMFVYDPAQDPRFREKCRDISSDPQLAKSDSGHLQASILTEAAKRIRQYSHMRADEKLKQPLMVLVSKSDIWGELIDEDITEEPIIPSASRKTPLAAVDVAKIERVSGKVRTLLSQIAPEFVATAEDCSSEVIYVPTSAVGCSPVPVPGSSQGASDSDDDGDDKQVFGFRPADIKPRWVTVPITYAFSRWAAGLIPMRN